MKRKQKKPIILILMVVVLFGGVAFMNRTPPKPGSDVAQAPQQPEEKSSDVASSVSDQLDNKESSAPQVMKPHGNGGPKPPPGMPSLQKPSMSSQKPKPNTSATSAQWYTPEANKK